MQGMFKLRVGIFFPVQKTKAILQRTGGLWKLWAENGLTTHFLIFKAQYQCQEFLSLTTKTRDCGRVEHYVSSS